MVDNEACCKCCLNENGLRDLWTGYISSDTGEFEIYGQMLTDCFTLPWAPPEEDDSSEEQICELCIDRVRIAYNFKKEILETHALLCDVGNQEVVKTESVNIEDDSSLGGEDDPAQSEENDVSWLMENMDQDIKQKTSSDQFQDVEYLEEDAPQVEEHIELSDESSDYEPINKKKKQKYQRKLYTELEMKKALALIQNKELTVANASEVFKIPEKTLRQRQGNKRNDDISRSRLHLKFVTEVQTVLKYTNATPFKSRSSRLSCAYCLTQLFSDPAELRNHTKEKHFKGRLRHLEFALRPAWTNEIMRVDITNLQCTICCFKLESWSEMMEHLDTQHHANFELAQTKLIPYLLDDQQYHCALCEKQYRSYNLLDSHMNHHYRNYLCLECGDPFMTENRLKNHSVRHVNGQYPCEVCGLVFTLEKYRKKHFANRHSLDSRSKCAYCKERFQGEYQRHLHIVEKHKEKVKIMTCSFCGREFTWMPYYLKHLKMKHSQKKAFQCKYCDQTFPSMVSRKKHNDSVHKTEKKNTLRIRLLRLANDVLVRKSQMEGEKD